MTTESRYVCTGGCGGSASEAEHSAGKTVCGTQGCPKQGQPFVKQAGGEKKGGLLEKLFGLFK